MSQPSLYAPGLQLYKAGQILPLQQIAEDAIARDPDAGDAWALLGLARRAGHNFAEAIAALEQATSLIPLPPHAACALGECYLRAKRLQPAGAIFAHLARDPHCPSDLLPSVASGLGRCGELELAIEACRTAAERSPERDEPLFAMAYYMRRLGYPMPVVLPVLERALALDPTCAVYRVSVGLFHQALGNRQQAYRVLCGLDLSRVRCGSCLRRVRDLFDACGDEARSAACLAWLDEAGEDPGCAFDA